MKKHKMDRHLISHQDWEIDYIVDKYGWKRKDVLAAIELIGRSRRKVYKYLREGIIVK